MTIDRFLGEPVNPQAITGRDLRYDPDGPDPTNDTLAHILAELQKDNPSVLCTTKLQTGYKDGIIASGDTSPHRISFSFSGANVPIFKLVAYSNFTTAYLGISGNERQAKECIPLTTTPLVLKLPLEQVVLITSGANDCNVNISADANGGVYIYGFTIPYIAGQSYSPAPPIQKQKGY